MAQTTGITITGVSGRMGQMLVREVAGHAGTHLVGAVERAGHDWIGQDLGVAMGGTANGIIVTGDATAAMADADAVIDFTAPAATLAFAQAAAETSAPVVACVAIRPAPGLPLRAIWAMAANDSTRFSTSTRIPR